MLRFQFKNVGPENWATFSKKLVEKIPQVIGIKNSIDFCEEIMANIERSVYSSYAIVANIVTKLLFVDLDAWGRCESKGVPFSLCTKCFASDSQSFLDRQQVEGMILPVENNAYQGLHFTYIANKRHAVVMFCQFSAFLVNALIL